MANEQIVTNIVANADFSGLITDLARVTSALNNLQNQAGATNKALANQIAVMNRQFGDTLRSTGQFTTHFVTIGSDVDKFGKNLDAGRGKLRDFYGAWQGYHKQTGGLVRDLAKQQVQLQNSILQPLGRNADGMMRFAVQVPRGLDEIKSKTAIAKQELQIMNRVIQEGAGQLINWGKNTQWAGRQLTVGLTVPIAAFGKAAADAFKEADEQLTRLTKVYGDVAGTSAEQLGKVRKDVAATAKELAASMGASFKDTLALSADIAATGKTGEELLGSIRETTRLSILGEVDRADAMKATLAIQSAFKQNTDELADSINFLNAVENQTSTSLGDLVEAIPKAGPVIKGLGGSIQDLALYLTAMREGGINATEGANALKSGLASLINPTNVAVGQFKSFGIDLLGIVNDNAGNVTKTLLALQGALDTLDPLAKQQAIEQLFGKFQFARMNALFENLGKQGSQTLRVLDLMKASTGELSDLAGRELSQVTESASGKYRRALAELKADLATVGEKFLTINTYLIKFVDKIVDFANNLPGPIKAILGFLGGITAIAGPLIMLTGVLGNFFGYVIKGVSHFKALFKGGEGWKLLTPEILAANKAGDLVEQTFYSDAKAAAVLNQALKDLTAQYDALAIRAQSGAISVNPVLTNISAQAQAQGLSRVVDKNHPLVGQYGTRASAHMVPRNVDQPRTIFGLVPSSIPVNAAIGENPQIYSEGNLPDIKGVTSIPATRTINGVKQNMNVSTGIVASEAARHHAYTAALAMQSEAELKALKQTLATTGTVSSEFMNTFDDLIPITSRITTKAAQQSALIVGELQEGKLTAAAAKQRIIELNLAIERELGAATSAYAGTVGRSINLTNVPGTNQPVQSPTGKSNMREMFKTRTGGIFTRIAEALKVKTSGAGYNIETTKLRRYNSGGKVEKFGSNKTVVSGPTSIGYDDRLGSVPLGGFVLNQGASLDPNNSDLVALAPYTFSGGGNVTAALTPGEVVFGPNINNIPGLPEALDSANKGLNIGGRVRAAKRYYGIRSTEYEDAAVPRVSGLSVEEMRMLDPKFRGGQSSYTVKGTSGLYIGDITDPTIINDPRYAEFVTNNKITREMINKTLEEGGQLKDTIDPDGIQRVKKKLPYQLMLAAVEARKTPYRNSTEQFLYSLAKSGVITETDARLASDEIYRRYSANIRSKMEINDGSNPMWAASQAVIDRNFDPNSDTRYMWDQFSEQFGQHTNTARRSTTARSIRLKTLSGNIVKVGKLQGDSETMFAHARTPKPLMEKLKKSGITSIARVAKEFRYSGSRPGRRLNAGGFIGGGPVTKARRNYGQIKISGTPGIGVENAATGSHITSTAEAATKDGMDTSGSMMAGMGLQTAGFMASSSNNETVSGMATPLMIAGTAMQFSPMLKPLTTAMKSVKTFGGMLTGLKGIAKSALMGVRSAFMFLTGPIGLTIIAVTALTALFLKLKDNATKAGAANRLAFGGTKESFESVGIKNYQSLTDRMEEYRKKVELTRAQVTSSYNSFTKAKGPTGLTLTIEQLDKAVANAKKNQKEYVEGFNNIDGSEVNKYAASLKAQFVGMGMSASDATNQIYAIIKASEKSAQAVSAVGSETFKSIQTVSNGISFMVKALKKEMNSDDFNAEEFATGIDTLLNSLYSYQQGLVGTKTKTGEILDETDAIKLALDKVVAIKGSENELSEDQLENLKDQNVVYGSILGTNENLRSITAKILMYNSGLGEIVDLSAMASGEAVALANNLKKVQDAMNEVTGKTTSDNPLSPLAKLRNAALKQSEQSQDAIKKLKKVDEDYYNNKIELLQKAIEKIKEEADARLKLIDIEQQRVDYESELSNAKLRYEQALANGDLAQAAQEQLALNKLNSDRQRQLTSQRIADKSEADQKALQAQIDDLNDQLKKAKDGYSAQTAKASTDLAAFQTLETFMNKIEQIAIRNYGKTKLNKADTEELAVIFKDMEKLGGKIAEAAAAMKAKYPDIQTISSASSQGVTTTTTSTWMQGIVDALKSSTKETKFASAVDKFAAAIEKFAGSTVTNTPQAGEYNDNNLRVDTSYLHFFGASGKKYYVKADSSNYQNVFENIKENGGAPIAWSKVKRKGYEEVSDYTKRYESGGKVSGPGTGTSDSIPAMLSNGEYVIKADSVAKYGIGTFDALNAQKLHTGGPVGHKHDAPHEMGMQWGGGKQKKKDGWLQRYANNLTAKEEATRSWLNRSRLTSWAAGSADPLGVNTLIRKLAGTDDNGSALGAALFFTNFMGMGIGPKLAQAGKFAGLLPEASSGTSSLKNIMLNNTKAKQLINSVYTRKDLTVGENIYPTYKLNGEEGRIAFQGYKENLSNLENSGIRVIKTTPESLLEEALRLNPNGKNLSTMLDNFKNNKIGKKERILLDEIAAATGINNKGRTTFGHQTDGFAMVLSSLSGNKTAQNIVDVKRNYMYEIIKAEKAASKNKHSGPSGRSYPENTVPADPSSVSVFHSTKFPIVRDAFGNIILYPHGQYAKGPGGSGSPRASVHTTLEAPVEDHVFGQWSNVNNKIITPLSSMIKDNGVPYNLNSTDTWWMRNPGQALKVSNGVVIRPFTNTASYYRALLNAGIIKNGQKAPLLSSDPVNGDIFRLAKDKFTPSDRDEILALAKQAETYIKEQDLLGNENAVLDKIATIMAKNKIKTNPSIYKLDQWSLGSRYRQDEIDMLVEKLGLRGGIHSQSGPEVLETHLMKSGQSNWNMLSQMAKDSIEAIRFATMFGRFKTNIRELPDPDAFDFANGGLVNIPKFDQGINMVPADMLAMIHKNEAIVPANMNPFNPNANNATMGGAQYNVNVTLNGSNMDANDVARVIARELKMRESMSGRSVVR